MGAVNIVRFRPMKGKEEEFEAIYKSLERNFPGLIRLYMVKGEDGTYTGIGEWTSVEALRNARPRMKENLDKFRHTLVGYYQEGGEITDPSSGEIIFEQQMP